MESGDATWEGNGPEMVEDTPEKLENQQGDDAQDITDADATADQGQGQELGNEQVAEAQDDQDDAASNEDYDPESVTFDQAPAASASAPPPELTSTTSSAAPSRAASKSRVSGGFVLEVSDDDDEEDDSASQSGATAQPGKAPSRSATNSVNPTSGPALAFPPGMPPMAGIDPVMMLEARIREDPRGDMDAWLGLIADYKRNNRLDEARTTYNRFLDVFPQSAEMWVDFVEMELELDNFVEAEKLFGRCLRTVPSVKLLTVYLNYIRRRNDLTNDPTGVKRQTIIMSYEFVLDTIGVDRDSGGIWQDYIQFIKNGPGDIRGTGWQNQQKMDQIRAIYQRAISIPMNAVNTLWKEYDQFEMTLNKLTGRKLIQERSPGYMTAKSTNIALDNITRNLKRTGIPRLPPAHGFDGAEEAREQIAIWRRWIAFEEDDPLVLAKDDPKMFQKRILYCYNQALMALRFRPEMWVDAAEWCLATGVRENEKDVGIDMLLQGIAANPESVLLALKHADHVETNYPAKEGDKSEYAKAVRKPFDDVLDTLYGMGDKIKEREKMEISTLKQAAAQPPVRHSIEQRDEDEEVDDSPQKAATDERIAAIQHGYAAESQLLSRTISYVWIAMARAMRRIQGKGSLAEGGLRKVFTDARQRGRLTSDVYVAVALLESIVYKDSTVGGKIFERGARLFPGDENFMMEYLKYLHAKDDTTNARVVFETCVNRLVAKPETVYKAKPLCQYFHRYECQYGELSQIARLEQRMAELFPEDPKLQLFAARYSSDTFNPVAAPLIISKAVQMRPKQANPVPVPTIEQHPVAAAYTLPTRLEHSPAPQYIRATASPKRPLNNNDDDDLNPPKRVARGASPLKGAAGRRMDQQRRNQASALHRDITFLLGILPPSHSYDAPRYSPAGLVDLLRGTAVPDHSAWKASAGQRQTAPPGHGRQPSTDMPGRPLSPYGRLGSAAAVYRNSPLRTESGGHLANPYPPPEGITQVPGWAPSPAGYGQQPPPAQYGGYRY